MLWKKHIWWVFILLNFKLSMYTIFYMYDTFIIVTLKLFPLLLFPLLPKHIFHTVLILQNSGLREKVMRSSQRKQEPQTSMLKPEKCDYVSYRPFKPHHTSWCFLFLRSWKRCWHHVTSGSQAAIYTDPLRTLGIRLDRVGQAGLPAVVRNKGQAEAPRWGVTSSLKIQGADDLCNDVRASKVTSVTCPQRSPVPQWRLGRALGVASSWGWGRLPPPVPSGPPDPSLPCLVTWLIIQHLANTHRAPVMCHTVLGTGDVAGSRTLACSSTITPAAGSDNRQTEQL